MDNQRRHDLEENELARNIEKVLEVGKPYIPTAIAVVIGLVGILLASNYLRAMRTSSSMAAWDSYHLAVEGQVPNLEQLNMAAEEFSGSTMSELAKATWADGQLFRASILIFNDREKFTENLKQAKNAYTVLASSREKRIRDRALFGLARTYELEGDIDKAVEQYKKVVATGGAFAQLAEMQLNTFENDTARESATWLAQAEVPRGPAFSGPGTPGQKPLFQAEGFDLEQPEGQESLDDLLQRYQENKAIQDSQGEATDRYAPVEGSDQGVGDDAATGLEEAGVGLDLTPAASDADAAETTSTEGDDDSAQ